MGHFIGDALQTRQKKTAHGKPGGFSGRKDTVYVIHQPFGAVVDDVVSGRLSLLSTTIGPTGSDPSVHRVFPIQRPLKGVVDDVFPNAIQFFFIPDNPLVIISLPYKLA